MSRLKKYEQYEGILKEVYGQVLTNPSGANMITGIARKSRCDR